MIVLKGKTLVMLAVGVFLFFFFENSIHVWVFVFFQLSLIRAEQTMECDICRNQELKHACVRHAKNRVI